MSELDEVLKEIEQRADAAWIGPWDQGEVDNADASFTQITAGSNGDAPFIEFVGEQAASDNGQFVAHARTDVPRLLAVIARLREQRNGAHYDGDCKARCCALWDAELLKILKGEQ